MDVVRQRCQFFAHTDVISGEGRRQLGLLVLGKRKSARGCKPKALDGMVNVMVSDQCLRAGLGMAGASCDSALSSLPSRDDFHALLMEYL